MNREKSEFSVDPDLNLSFGGGPGTKLDRSRLRLLKQELVARPGRDDIYTRTIAKEFVPGMRSMLEKIPQGSNLIIMPSTTGTNTVPAHLATQLKKERSDLYLINAKEDMIWVAHYSESKIKHNYQDRTYDPRRFGFNSQKLDKLVQQGRPSYIVDDSISTGESAFVLQRQLSKEGIHAQGVIAGVVGEKYHVRASDMRRLYERMTEDYPSYYEPKQLKEDIHTHFAGFPRTKITSFERELSRQENPDIPYRYLQQSAEYYRRQELDPKSVLDRTYELSGQHKSPKRSLQEQLKIDYPNLSEEDINRYADIMQQRQKQEGTKSKGQDFGNEL